MKKNRVLITGLAVLTATLMLSPAAFASRQPAVPKTTTAATTTPAAVTDTVTDREMPVKENVSGSLPYLNSYEDKDIQDKVNQSITDLNNNTITAAERGSEVSFSYKVTGDTKYLSLVMNVEVNPGNTSSNDVHTIVLSKQEPKICTLKDLMSTGDVDAYKTATDIVRKQIAQDTDKYLAGEADKAVVDKDSAFYVDDKSQIVVVFDKYSIAPGATGVPSFVLGTLGTI